MMIRLAMIRQQGATQPAIWLNAQNPITLAKTLRDGPFDE
jgi:hypothetical protein